MSNVIRLNVPPQRQGLATRHAATIDCFANHRRFGDDVFWLKENAELLNILECTGAELEATALAPHQKFYGEIEKRLGFFPQYYRFLLSICLDLEDLGFDGHKGEALCHWVAQQGLAEAELSDLQRAEARRLLNRRGCTLGNGDQGLDARLHAFISRPETFAMPNKKAAYELTHIVFYLSEYGRRDPELSDTAVTSLEYAGILAYLDQNADLLAEICVALRYAGCQPSQIWEDWLERETHRFDVEIGQNVAVSDNYHDYFVCNWLLAQSGRDSFVKPASFDRMSFTRPAAFAGPLRDMSECIFGLQENRSDDWTIMRPMVEDALTEIGNDILIEAQESSEKFADFFAGFARTGMRGVTI